MSTGASGVQGWRVLAMTLAALKRSLRGRSRPGIVRRCTPGRPIEYKSHARRAEADARSRSSDPLGDESCLFLNVYRPANVDASQRLPVLFWIHGGNAP